MRLRDVGGIIVIDFIDMESQGNRDKVLHELRTHLGRDRARTRAFQVSELGLIEMTRQRVRPSLWHHDERAARRAAGRAGCSGPRSWWVDSSGRCGGWRQTPGSAR